MGIEVLDCNGTRLAVKGWPGVTLSKNNITRPRTPWPIGTLGGTVFKVVPKLLAAAA